MAGEDVMAARKRKGTIDPTGVQAATKIGVVLTPSQIAANGTEHGHQCAVFQWVVLHGKSLGETNLGHLRLLFAIPNGGDRKASVAASMRAEGVKPGVPDLMLPLPVGCYAGLWIEMKVPGRERQKDGGRQPKQVEWHRELRARQYAVCTCYGWVPAVWALAQYLGGMLPQFKDDGLPVDASLVKTWAVMGCGVEGASLTELEQMA